MGVSGIGVLEASIQRLKDYRSCLFVGGRCCLSSADTRQIYTGFAVNIVGWVKNIVYAKSQYSSQH